jgi:putative salt-induced outer membrane protein YdiY
MQRNRYSNASTLLPTLLLALLGPSGVKAQEQETGWKDVAELTFVLTSGNATSSTFGFKNTADYTWPNAAFKLSAGGVRTRSGTVTRTATGTPDNFTVSKTTDTRTTAESYFLKGRLDRNLSEALFAFGGAGWDRNTFAGVENRYAFVGGAGRAWFAEDTRHLKTDLGLTYTIQDDVVENPEVDDSFLGLRASYDYLRKLTDNTEFTSVLVADQNLNETSDLRTDWTNSLAVAMSDRLALKTSYQLLYDKSPALVAVPLGDDEVLAPLGKVDGVFTVAIVASF